MLGCDVSRWQGGINWSVFNLDFVFYKATGGDGGLYIDSRFFANAAGFTTAEGAYHFASKMAFDPVVEADYFCDALLRSDWANLPASKKLPPVLDWEPTNGNPAGGAAWCLKFLYRVWRRTGVKPWIYTANWCRPFGSVEEMRQLRDFTFWLAAYVSERDVDRYGCPPWGTDWGCWQYSSTGSVSGVVGKCDSNAMRRDVFINALAGGYIATPKPLPVKEVLPMPGSPAFRFPDGRMVYIGTDEKQHNIKDPDHAWRLSRVGIISNEVIPVAVEGSEANDALLESFA